MPAPTELTTKLAGFNQEHLLRYWDNLDAAAQQRLREQIEAIDFEQIAALFGGETDQHDWHAEARRAEPQWRCASRSARRGRVAASG